MMGRATAVALLQIKPIICLKIKLLAEFNPRGRCPLAHPYSARLINFWLEKILNRK